MVGLFLLIVATLLFTSKVEGYVNLKNDRSMDSVIQAISDALNERVEAVPGSTYSDPKYQTQIVALRNALNYAKYIQTNSLTV
jgi:hypothetical protein